MIPITVIIPIYNVESYLRKCIDSVINQTMQEIEIILVDDGSTDSSPQICDEYALKDDRIKVIHKINGGLSDARNVGIDIARGIYLTFVDSDDWIDKNFCKYLYTLAKEKNADIVQCNFTKVYEEDIHIELELDVKEVMYSGVEALNLLYGEEETRTVIACGKIYKKKLFEQIRFPKGKIHEDEFTTYKLIHKANKVIDTNLQLYYYLQRQGSITKTKFTESRMHALEAYKERIQYFEQHKLDILVKKTQGKLCTLLKYLYLKALKSDIHNKKKLIKVISRELKRNFWCFIKNPYITHKGKITFILCLLNKNIFCKVYSRYVE